MTYDDWKTTDPPYLRYDWYDNRDDDRDDRDDVPEYLDETPSPADVPTKTTPLSEYCTGCAGTGWAGGVVFSKICEAGCAGAGTRLVWP